jgi:hypothetical protein
MGRDELSRLPGDRSSPAVNRRRVLATAGRMATAGLLMGAGRTAAFLAGPDDIPRPVHASGMVATRETAGTVLVTPHGEGVSASIGARLNPLAAEVWRLADGRRSVADIAALVAARHHVPERAALDDVSAFVDVLVQHRFLTLARAAR